MSKAKKLGMWMVLVVMLSNSVFAVWDTETVISGTAISTYSESLALDSNDNPHIAYYNSAQTDLKYAVWDGSSWSTEVVDSEYDPGMYASIDLDSSGNPHIIYLELEQDGTPMPNSLEYAEWDGSSWTVRALDDPDSESYGYSLSFALDENDYPHVSYYASDLGSLRHLEYDSSGIHGITTVAVAEDSSLAFDSSYVPYISTAGAFFRWDESSSSWIDEGGIPEAVHIDHVSLAFDSADNAHVSYIDTVNNYLKYAFWDGSSWTIDAVDDSGDVLIGYKTSLALDSNDRPHISYIDETKGDIKYAFWDGSSWNIEVVDNDGAEAHLTSLALDSDDIPHIAYSKPDGLHYASPCTDADSDTYFTTPECSDPGSSSQNADYDALVMQSSITADESLIEMSSDNKRGLIRFSTSLPSDAVIDSAALRLFVEDMDSNSYLDVNSIEYDLSTDPSDDDASALYDDAGDGIKYADGKPESDFIPNMNSDYTSIDLTSAASDIEDSISQGWFAVGLNTYRDDGSATKFKFRTLENSQNKPPVLEIEYHTKELDCDDTNASINPDAVEACDNTDNDCDGQVDEDFPVGDSCTAGVGACEATGTLVCNAEGTGTECDAVAGTPPEDPEVSCDDGIDNDCDGFTDTEDEDCALPETCSNLGGSRCDFGEICKGGSMVAADDTGFCCVGGTCSRGIYDISDNDFVICHDPSCMETDYDNDGIMDFEDNCNPLIYCPNNYDDCYNPEQEDTDLDGIGDVCDCVDPFDNLVIDKDTVLCRDTYVIPDPGEDGVIKFEKGSIQLDCNGAVLVSGGECENPGDVNRNNFIDGEDLFYTLDLVESRQEIEEYEQCIADSTQQCIEEHDTVYAADYEDAGYDEDDYEWLCSPDCWDICSEDPECTAQDCDNWIGWYYSKNDCNEPDSYDIYPDSCMDADADGDYDQDDVSKLLDDMQCPQPGDLDYSGKLDNMDAYLAKLFTEKGYSNDCIIDSSSISAAIDDDNTLICEDYMCKPRCDECTSGEFDEKDHQCMRDGEEQLLGDFDYDGIYTSRDILILEQSIGEVISSDICLDLDEDLVLASGDWSALQSMVTGNPPYGSLPRSECSIPGDASGNNYLDGLDLFLINKYISEPNQYSPFCCDANEDGKVNETDLEYVSNKLLGLAGTGIMVDRNNVKIVNCTIRGYEYGINMKTSGSIIKRNVLESLNDLYIRQAGSTANRIYHNHFYRRGVTDNGANNIYCVEGKGNFYDESIGFDHIGGYSTET